jgi:hypothetical protein
LLSFVTRTIPSSPPVATISVALDKLQQLRQGSFSEKSA